MWERARRALAGGLTLVGLGVAAGAETAPQAIAVAAGSVLQGSAPGHEPALRVVTSVLPLAWLAQEVGGPRVEAFALVPPGASPHTFEPLPADLRRLSGAALFIRAGGGFDDWAEGLVPSGGVELRRMVGETDDPHGWLDPIRVRDTLAPRLTAWLVALDRDGEAHYSASLAAFQQRLTELDGEIRVLLEPAPHRDYVAYHNAWRSFAQRYGLSELAVVEERPGQEPSPRELARLVDAARSAGVRAILVEPQLDPRTAAVIASEFGGETVLVDPLGDPDDPERASYESLLRFDARAFARALGVPGHE